MQAGVALRSPSGLGLRLGLVLQGLRSGHKLLQFSLDGGVADVLILEHSVSVDCKRCGNCTDAKCGCDFALKAAIARLCPGHLVLAQKVAPLGVIGIETDAHDHQGLSGELLRDVANVGQCLAARAAPGGPEVDEDDLSSEVVERDSAVVDRLDGERRGHLQAHKFGAVGKALGAFVIGIFGTCYLHVVGESGSGGLILVQPGEGHGIPEDGVLQGWVCLQSSFELVLTLIEQIVFVFGCAGAQQANM